MTRTVLISGASIAGPALAYWLSRHGFAVTVVERAPAPRPGGYKIDIRGAASTVCARMGVAEQIRAVNTKVRGVSFVTADNKPIATMDADFMYGRAGGDTELWRADLSRILIEACPDTVEWSYGDTITALTQTEAGVDVDFARAAPRRFDLVVGADGLHSTTRALAFGAEARYLRHLGRYISIFTTRHHLDLNRWELFHNGVGGTVSVYRTGPSEDAKGLFLFGAGELGIGSDLAAQRRVLRERFGHFGWQAPELLAELDTAPDFYFDAIAQIRMPSWSTGRIALLGDAGYCASPASGQGTSLAIVGAYVLAGELAAATEHTAAFAAYERIMRPYVRANQELGVAAAKGMVTDTAWELWLRRFSMRMLKFTPSGARNRIAAKMHEQIQQAAHAIDLPDYPVRAAS